MLVREERLVLQYLRHHSTCSLGQIFKACFPGTPLPWGQRVLQNLEWLGYITVFSGADGQPETVQITTQGKEIA